jgi:glycosyltransferase involved in cell wall biosynthesis
MQIAVLYIQHVGAFGGAARSLLEMIKGFPEGTVRPHIIAPRGTAADIFRSEGIPVLETRGISQFDNTRWGYYRGIRWLLLIREFCFFFSTLFALLRARSRWKHIELVHVNEVTALVPIVLAKLIFGTPVVTHVRCVVQSVARYRIGLLRSVLKRFADSIIAIDYTVRRSIPQDLKARVIHNGFSPSLAKEPEFLHPILARPHVRLRVAMIGTLMASKGVYEFVQAAKLCCDRELNVEFIIMGQDVRKIRGIIGVALKWFNFSHPVRNDIERFIAEHRLEDRIHLLGFSKNIRGFYENIDVLCFPSHLNAVGRPVFEAAFSKVPSIVAIDDPIEDTIIEGETGLCIPEKDAHALASAIEYFCANPAELRRMGENAYSMACANFDATKNAREVLDLYKDLISRVKGDAAAKTATPVKPTASATRA